MNYIKKLVIKGFKKFDNFEIEFNKNLNVIVGENEAGKSTILNAIDVVLNQRYKNTDKYIVKEMLSINSIKKFKETKNSKDLPKIVIEVYLEMDSDSIRNMNFNGEKNLEGKSNTGIRFTCEFNSEYLEDLEETISQGIIPYEYYDLTWKTFSGEAYKILNKPLTSVIIDNSDVDSNNSFNYYNKMIFNTTFEKKVIAKTKDDFRNNLSVICDKIGLNNYDDVDVMFGINEKKVIFENIITVLDNDIPLENKGKGTENLIKTQIALDKKKTSLSLVLIEEPENHLSHTNLRKMISEIQEHQGDGQVILTTHSNLIVNRLNLKNVLWITENEAKSLKSLDSDDSDFFEKMANNNILQFILAKKVVLIEGPTEYILIPKIYNELFGHDLDSDEIDILSCEGISYKRYMAIAEQLKKKVVVITDNDEKQKNIEDFEKFNDENVNMKIFSDTNIANWTWEVCMYNLNKKLIDKIIKVNKKSDYTFKNVSYKDNKVLGKMLNNKTDCAIDILKDMDENAYKYKIPEYVSEALEWIRG